MAAAMCQALPSFYSDYCKKSLFISISSDFYKKYIVTQDYCVSTHNSLCSLENCKFHLVLIGISLSQNGKSKHYLKHGKIGRQKFF